MGLLQRGIIFFAGTVANGILFVFHSRVLLEVLAMGQAITGGSGPATGALNLLPTVMQLVIGGFQLGLIFYLLGGLGQQKTTAERPLP